MATLSDLNRIAIVSEVTPGTTPATPAFEKLRLLSESVTSTNNNVDSGELDPSRGLSDTINAGAEVGGTIEAYCVYDSSYIEAILSVLGATVVWPSTGSSGATTQGTAVETFTLERTIQNADDRQSYARYSGLSFSSVAWNFTPNDPLTMTFGVMGGAITVAEDAAVSGDAQIDGVAQVYASPSPADALPMTGDQVTLTWTAGTAALATALNGSEITAMSITIDSQNREIDEIGEVASDVVLGKLAVGITFTSLFESNAIKDAELANTDTNNQPNLTVTMTDSASNVYTLNFPRVKIQQATAITPTTNSDVVYEVEAVALVNSAVVCTFTAAQG